MTFHLRSHAQLVHVIQPSRHTLTATHLIHSSSHAERMWTSSQSQEKEKHSRSEESVGMLHKMSRFKQKQKSNHEQKLIVWFLIFSGFLHILLEFCGRLRSLLSRLNRKVWVIVNWKRFNDRKWNRKSQHRTKDRKNNMKSERKERKVMNKTTKKKLTKNDG